MIWIAIVYIIFVAYELHFLKQRKVEIKPYIYVFLCLFIMSELLFFYRDQFQIIELVEQAFGAIEKSILLK